MTKYIDIIVGFFESGKTSFINSMLLNEVDIEREKVLIIKCEEGFEEYLFKDKINVININNKRQLEDDIINKKLNDINPDYVIIEYNGVWEISDLLKRRLAKGYEIRNIINTIDYNSFENYIKNMENIILDKVHNSDYIIITKFDEDNVENRKELELIKAKLKSINKSSKIYLKSEFDEHDRNLIINNNISLSDKQIIKFALGFIFINFFVMFCQVFFNEFYNNKVERILAIFLSILIQILPFLILGVIISSLIQMLIPKEKFDKIFEKTSVKSMLFAMFAGLFFPVCDCTMVPIASSIVKKGYSIPVAITFLLAAPAINPIVILSTYYAFPNQPMFVFYRIGFGICIAVFAGIITILLARDKEEVVKDYINKYTLTESSISYNYRSDVGKLEAISLHTKNELYKIGFYVVIGAFISASIQVFVPKYVFISLNQINYLSVLSMIFAAFFISVCSNSNAFVARSFYNLMPSNAILAFLVMGPMLDITNVSLMLATFNKKFIFKMILFLTIVSLVIFSSVGGGILNV
ncbi:permease [Peptostreptococcus equinus]|uniref:Permease n=1 Tax=Peptostreptococcus equinus TaxID=3003601 RepID=A0ABY7JNB7_9FIRM|nr:permease [Peptostreptococcus sp. CBA3647]WAW14875.1 permease [Peptostreptococcus sp. CBA3647]